MARVTGLGGVFVKAKDPVALRTWYRDMLGMDVSEWGAMMPNEDKTYAVWSAHAADTKYFAPSDRPFMINLRVDDLDALLAKLRQAGANVPDRREDSEFGKFGYVVDPEGTLLELFQPAE